METYNQQPPESITFAVRTVVKACDLEEATRIARDWVTRTGGEASVYRHHTRPWKGFRRVAHFGPRP